MKLHSLQLKAPFSLRRLSVRRHRFVMSLRNIDSAQSWHAMVVEVAADDLPQPLPCCGMGWCMRPLQLPLDLFELTRMRWRQSLFFNKDFVTVTYR